MPTASRSKGKRRFGQGDSFSLEPVREIPASDEEYRLATTWRTSERLTASSTWTSSKRMCALQTVDLNAGKWWPELRSPTWLPRSL
jgi:hypothetical protein